MTINALNIIPVRTASCSVMGDYALKQKATVAWSKKKVGDIVLFDFNRNGTSDHTGIIIKINADGSIETIEGNTSETSNDNGGNVMKRTRFKSQTNYVVRPKYNDKVTAQMVVGTAYSQLGIKENPKNSNHVKYNTWYYGKEVKGDAYPWCMTYVEWDFAHVLEKAEKPIGKYTGIIPQPKIQMGDKGKEAKQLQEFLDWYGIRTNNDGDFGRNSMTSLIRFQLTEGLTPDGVYGKNTYKAAMKYKAETDTPTEPSQPTGTTVLGKCIDVSYWQGKITEKNWEKVKKTCKYAIIRASYTSQKKFTLSKDSTFGTNYVNAKSAGLTVGVYHYSQAITVDEAKAEAEYLCDILKDFTAPTFWVVCDYEFGGRLNSNIGKKASAIANAFCEVVEKHGYKACIYANLTMLNKYLTEPKYPVWIAQYNSTCSYKKEKVMWQYTSSGKVDGISGKVDLSHVYAVPVPVVEKKGYEGTFPTANNNIKIVNGMCYRMCYPYGTPQKKYTYADGKPREAYAKGIDEAFPNHMSWSNKKQRVGACCDMLPGTVLRLIGIPSPKHLKDQVKELPKMTDKLKDNGHYKANEFVLGDFVQRFKSTGHGHTWFVCELINGEKYVANAHYRKLDGTYAVMDAKPSTVDVKKYASYHCFTILRAIRTYYEVGDYGYDVKYIQEFLNWYGIKCTVDGDFGANTEKAVKKFQEAEDLTIDGKVGTKTIAAMKAVRK